MDCLCLACGAPYLPIGEDVAIADKVGNMSVMYFQRQTRASGVMRYIRAPTFCSKLEASHVFHESHHQHAVRVICEHRLTDAALSFANGPDNVDGWFPFARHPKGRDPQSLVAEWDRPADGDRLVHQALLDLLPADGEDMPDYNVKVACCQDCNHLMTMEFWFRYHLYGSMDDNEHRLIPTDAIRVQPANAGRHPLREWEQWGAPLGPVTSFPQDQYLRTQDIMSAAVGYYLHRCLPVGVTSTPRTKLYVAMCWVVLEVTCLLCELVKGSLNAEDTPALIKRNKPQKNALGCIELYLSYMAWRVLGFKHRRVRNMAFERWHTFYFAEAAHCPGVFRQDIAKTLIADRITPVNMHRPSGQLILHVSKLMARVIDRRLSKLADFFENRADPGVDQYFLPVANVNQVCAILGRAPQNDLDSCLRLVGIDALWYRVVDLSRDFDEAILKRLKAFRSAWRKYEVQNVARHQGDKSTRRAAVECRLCRLLDPPTQREVDQSTPAQLAETLAGDECGRWTSVLALRGLGAFDFEEESPD